ncbi:MAG: ribbon-helix-helix protein, CopG family [Terriglobales bacterium]|jgi:hypothetical protein
MKRISINLSEEQAAGLKARAAATGVLQSEQIRRAIDGSLAKPTPRVPILVVQKTEE